MHIRNSLPRAILPLLALAGLFAACADDDVGGAINTADGGIDGGSGDSRRDLDAPDVADSGAFDGAPDAAIVVGPSTFSNVYAHTCSLADGGVRCWGWNLAGALGSDDAGGKSAALISVEGLTDAIEIAAGGHMSCALRSDRSVVCWGSNGFGELGQGSPAPASSHLPLSVPSLSNVRTISAGYTFACAVRDDRTVACWGRNENGALGSDAGMQSTVPIAVPGIADVDDLTAGALNSCVVHTNRTVSCWGGGKTAAPVPALTDVSKVAVGFAHACALRAGGTVSCWGTDNSYGQLGPAATGASAMPVEVTGLSNVIAIGAGYFHTCAVRAGGTVACWGRNTSGALGSGDAAAPASSTPLDVAVSDAVLVGGGADFSCARRAGEKASCWGSNNVAQLGAATDAGSSASPVEVLGF